MGNEYSTSFKETMVRRMSGPGARSAGSLSNESGVPQSTLSRWLREYGSVEATGGMVGSKGKQVKRTAEEKLQAVQEYDNQPDEESRGRFLRERGLYSVEIQRWREEILAALNGKPDGKDPRDQRIRELERELRRKEKALAETAALLTLKKTAQQIWGDSEDGK